jgi:hypothetical protein
MPTDDTHDEQQGAGDDIGAAELVTSSRRTAE